MLPYPQTTAETKGRSAAAGKGNRTGGMGAGLVDWLTKPLLPQPAEIRDRLAWSLFERGSMLLAATASVFTMAVAALIVTGGAWWPALWLASDLGLAVYRLRLIRMTKRNPALQDQNVPRMLVAGIIWAILFGWGCCLSLTSGDAMLAIMAGMNVAGVASATILRLAALPRYAMLVVALSILPFGLGAGWMGGEIAALLLLIPVWMVAFVLMAYQNHLFVLRVTKADLAVRRAALTDSLTGLRNRMHLDEELARMCGGLVRGESFALLSLDLDGFKQVNDRFGHGAGDILLKAVARRLRDAVREQDSVYRPGGDEFILLLPGAGADTAASIAGRIIETVAQPFEIGTSNAVRIGVSIGSVTAPENGRMPADLLAAADQALYAAKREGKGTHRPYRALMRARQPALSAQAISLPGSYGRARQPASRSRALRKD